MCDKCNSKENIVVHHLTYDNIYNEKMKDLMYLCKNCHDREHGSKPKKQENKQIKKENKIKNIEINKKIIIIVKKDGFVFEKSGKKIISMRRIKPNDEI